jgi:AraC-like DNA-binding protein
MQRFAYSTDDLPPDYDEQARLAHWQDFAASIYGAIDFTPTPDRPFSVNMRMWQTGPVTMGALFGTVTQMSRARCVDAEMNFTLGVNCGSGQKRLSDGSRETWLAPGSMVLIEGVERNEIAGPSDLTCMSVHLPRRSLLELVPDAADRLCEGLDPDAPAVRHLNRYLAFVRGCDEVNDLPQLGVSIATTIVDLAAIALGAGRDGAMVASMRGVRGARLQQLLNIIQANFADPSFSAAAAATRLGVTPRTIQLLLEETGSTFSERVLELRLQKSRTMLVDPRCDRLKIGEIALACGFGDATYFNRCFRRRFGTTPTQYRGSAG